jgi:hypothetical protein
MSLRRTRPFLRCGDCDRPFEPGEPTRYVDDERVHLDCDAVRDRWLDDLDGYPEEDSA